MAMSSEVFGEILSRHKNDLSQGQMNALKRAGETMTRHYYVGTTLGCLAGLFYARRRGFKAWPSIFGVGTGLIVGSQVGLGTGALVGARSIRSLPQEEQQHIAQVMKDVRQDLVAAARARSEGSGMGAGPGGLRIDGEGQARDPSGPDAIMGRPGQMVGAGRSIEREPYASPMNVDPTYDDATFGKGRNARELAGESGVGFFDKSGQKGEDRQSERWNELRKSRTEAASSWERIRQDQRKEELNQAQSQASSSSSPTSVNASSNASAHAGTSPRAREAATDLTRSQKEFDAMMNKERQGGDEADKNTFQPRKGRRNQYGDIVEE